MYRVRHLFSNLRIKQGHGSTCTFSRSFSWLRLHPIRHCSSSPVALSCFVIEEKMRIRSRWSKCFSCTGFPAPSLTVIPHSYYYTISKMKRCNFSLLLLQNLVFNPRLRNRKLKDFQLIKTRWSLPFVF